MGRLGSDGASHNDAPPSSSEVRERLVDALRLDLVGPWAGHPLANERLTRRMRPSTWYLTGFLIPSSTAPDDAADADESDDMDAEVAEAAGLAEESTEERKAAKKGFWPSSMGLSFLVPATTDAVSVTVRWGDYAPSTFEEAAGDEVRAWARTPREVIVEVRLAKSHEQEVPGSGGLRLHVVSRAILATGFEEHLPLDTRSVSVFLVNQRPAIAGESGEPDEAFAFQAEVEVRSTEPFMPRPDLRGTKTDTWDDQLADLHYADAPSFATGHGTSVDWETVDGACRVVRSVWIPTAEVEKTETVSVPDVELSMGALGKLANGEAAAIALSPLVAHYRTWIDERTAELGEAAGQRKDTARELLRRASLAADRIQHGIDLLARDPDALDAFRVANRAVGRALRKRLELDDPRWRAFQLAFVLLNLPGLADPANEAEREIVDLLFFPTGGGKTEAYLGLAAFAMVHRRLCNPGDDGLAGAGVSVIMRYTLRLLTLDQLARAAGLVCALELEREADVARYGRWPFEIGLWVGKAATPNVLGYKGFKGTGDARSKVRQFKKYPKTKPSPIPLENCPWCGERFTPNSFNLRPDDDQPRDLRITCMNFECDFARDRRLPIVAVDEPIYRRLPAFLIATVDKFASLPWVAHSGMLLGGAERANTHGFYGPADPREGNRLSAPLPPPDLIIQDELHLIAGPLGTMAGLYEAAIETLCTRDLGGKTIRPKIVASTATVRRADDQIQALFGRARTDLFPPQGPDRRDSFFARTVPSSKAPARLYAGIAAQGRNPKVMMRRAWLALMGAAERSYGDAGGHENHDNPADPYMTVLGYFNSLRELGGARRILEEEVQNTIKDYGERMRVGEERGLFRDRMTFSEVVELTSRVPTDKVAEARRQLECRFHEKQRVDCALATNMISVGLDIPRLGLMVVLGQPKLHAEYIQATSRVGRDEKRPGLVVTLLNIHKPRDRSHYERFRHYHETFYRAVEVASVTPFSARALDRGFAGAMMSLARHAHPELTPPAGVESLAQVRADLEHQLRAAFLERVNHQPMGDDERAERLNSVQSRIVDLLDAWDHVVQSYHDDGVSVQYQRYETDQRKPLLREMLDSEFESEHHRKFRANRSLRDVEPEVNLFLKNLSGSARTEGA